MKRTESQWPEEYSKWPNIYVVGVPENDRGEEPEFFSRQDENCDF